MQEVPRDIPVDNGAPPDIDEFNIILRQMTEPAFESAFNKSWRDSTDLLSGRLEQVLSNSGEVLLRQLQIASQNANNSAGGRRNPSRQSRSTTGNYPNTPMGRILQLKGEVDAIYIDNKDDPAYLTIVADFNIYRKLDNIYTLNENSVYDAARAIIDFRMLMRELADMEGLVDFKVRIARTINGWLAIPDVLFDGYLNVLLLGNPGTGKTTAGIILGKLYYTMGLLARSTSLIEPKVFSSQDLIAPFAGQTPVRTKNAFISAMGGAVLLDEAYSLVTPAREGESQGRGFGQEALSTLIQLLSEFKGIGMWMFAGYEDRVKASLVKGNPGFPRRIRDTFLFQNYTVTELVNIMQRVISNVRLTLQPDTRYIVDTAIRFMHQKGTFRNLNAGGVKSLVREILLLAAGRNGRRANRYSPSINTMKEAINQWLVLNQADYILQWGPRPNDSPRDTPAKRARRTSDIQAQLKTKFPEYIECIKWDALTNETARQVYDFLVKTKAWEPAVKSVKALAPLKGQMEFQVLKGLPQGQLMLPRNPHFIARGIVGIKEPGKKFINQINFLDPRQPTVRDWKVCNHVQWRVGVKGIAFYDQEKKTIGICN